MYWMDDVCKACETAFHRLHMRIFDDKYWGLDDYAELYGPLVLFIAFEVLVYVIAGILH